MSITFENFKYSYMKKQKPIFVPTSKGAGIGSELIKEINGCYKFDDFIYHNKEGSHILALHRHRNKKYFCRVDLKNFFYSIKRNRVKRKLKTIGVKYPEHYAKWSTVKNPYEGGGYVVPYGFMQSPIIATLVLMESPVGRFLRGLDSVMTVSVYMDDICISSDTLMPLENVFQGLIYAVEQAGFVCNFDKTASPAPKINIFNCSLEHGATAVLPERIDAFNRINRSGNAIESFNTYCAVIQSRTWRTGGKRRKARKHFKALPKI